MPDGDFEKLRGVVALANTVLPGRVLARFGTALLDLAGRNEPTGLDDLTKAAKAAAVQDALEKTGSYKEAAQQLGVSLPTLRKALRDFPISDPPPLWDDPGMSQFDASLFPFVRIRWDAEPSEGFLNDYKVWMLTEVIPQSMNAGERFVVLEDCSAWNGLPSVGFMVKAQSITKDIQATLKQRVLGTVVLAPNSNWLTWWNPLARLTSISARFASAPDQAVGFAIELFQNAGVEPPNNLLVN